DSWRNLPKMRSGRRGCAVAVVRDSLYAIGGHDGNGSLASVEILDHPNGNWRPGPPLNTPRANTSAVVTAGNVIYVVGGFNANTFLPTMELLENGKLSKLDIVRKYFLDYSIDCFQNHLDGETGNRNQMQLLRKIVMKKQ